MRDLLAQRMEILPFSEIRVMMEKANKMEQAGEKVIHLELGRPDFDTPIFIKEACMESLKKGNVFYTSNYGSLDLRQAISDKLYRDNQVLYGTDEILVTVGLCEAIFNLCGALLDKGDEVLIPNPAWLNYVHMTNFFGATPVTYNLCEDNDFQINIEELKGKITPKTKLLILVSPSNPTGGVLSPKTIEEIARIAMENDIWVVSDEIYEKLIYDEGKKHTSIASLPEMKKRTVTLNGFSKAYSMTGWRIGYMAAPRDIIQAAVRIHQYNTACATSFVQDAAIAALKHGESSIQNMVKEYKRRRDYVVDAINGIEGLKCKKPDGAFYIFINMKKLNMSSKEVSDYLLDEAKVALVPGSTFGSGGEGYIRLSYANSYENLVEACQRIKNAINKL